MGFVLDAVHGGITGDRLILRRISSSSPMLKFKVAGFAPYFLKYFKIAVTRYRKSRASHLNWRIQRSKQNGWVGITLFFNEKRWALPPNIRLSAI